MSAANWIQLAATLGVLFSLAPLLAGYMARVFEGERHPLSFLSPLERGIHRICGIDPSRGMDWKEYVGALLSLNAAGFLLLLAMLMTQAWLPLNPQKAGNMSWHLAFNTAVSFMTNTNWQAYSGETAVSHLAQMAGLAVQNFLSAATGMAAALAMIRGIRAKPVRSPSLGAMMRRIGVGLRLAEPAPPMEHRGAVKPATLGNFWVDVTRCILFVLLPLSLVLAVLLASQGVVQTFSGPVEAVTMEGKGQTIPMGPAASQVAIKQIGTNGGGFFGVNSAHPLENPTPFSGFLELLSILLLPVSFPFLFGRMVRSPRQGRALFAAMTALFLLGMAAILAAEFGYNGMSGGAGTMEGKETRFGISGSALWAQFTTAASNGSVNSMHDSYSPLGGLVPLANIMLGEVIYGGVGCGLYGMLLFVILTVFLAGLMVGRTPEYLGKKIEAREVQLAMLAIVGPNLAVLFLSAAAVATKAGLSSLANQGPHGLSEILYAFSSGVGNNGSAFAGLSANTVFYNLLLGIAMLIGRFVILVPAVAIGGRLAGKRPVPAGAGTFATDGVPFTVLLVAVILVVVGLTFFPALVLGPLLEHFLALRGKVF